LENTGLTCKHGEKPEAGQPITDKIVLQENLPSTSCSSLKFQPGFHQDVQIKTLGFAYQGENLFETTNFKFSLILLNDF
jgi:hypothetical protein